MKRTDRMGVRRKRWRRGERKKTTFIYLKKKLTGNV